MRNRVGTPLTADQMNALWKADGKVHSETVIDFVHYVRGMATRAVVSLNTGLNVRDSIEELDAFLDMLDRYRDVLK